MEYSSLRRFVEKMLHFFSFFFTTPHTLLSVIEWADNGGAAAAHKETAMSITPPLSPLGARAREHVYIPPPTPDKCVGCASAWVPPA